MMGPQSRLINSRERRRIPPLFPEGSERELAFHHAGEGFRRRMDQAARQQGVLPFLNALALDEDHIPHVFAAMGFDLRVTIFERGKLRWWPASLGPVWMMSRSQPELVVYVDRYSGRWTPSPRATRKRHHCPGSSLMEAPLPGGRMASGYDLLF